jgi:hypothetical protein
MTEKSFSGKGVSPFIEIICAYQICLIGVGTLANLISFYVCRKMKSYPTFVILSYLSVMNVFTLFQWNFESFMPVFFGIDWKSQHLYLTCHMGDFIQYSSLESSSWLVVTSAVNQYMCIKVHGWRMVYFRSAQAHCISILIILSFVLLNINILYGLDCGHVETLNDTTVRIICSDNSNFITNWSKFHSIVYSLMPFSILIATNFSLIRHLYRKKNKVKERKIVILKCMATREHSVTKTIVTQAIAFIFMTSPSATASFYYSQLAQSDQGRLVLQVCNSISFSFHALNFFVYLVTNKKFRKFVCKHFKRQS